mmetsp:Transcript_4751/g.8129  ORF Transcript_4751/g.8129 Transcript_4751/m.8129 type:complete len:723 (+) Transcript_4751:73-2241(+)
MEIKITSSDGVQDNSIISIRAAGTRRQAPIDTVKSKALKFPDSLEKCCMEPVKIDIYVPVATARLVLQPTEGSYRLPLDHKDAIATNLGLVVSNSKDSGDSQTVATEVPGRPSSAERYKDAAASAREYLEEHGLLRYIQSLLHAVIQVKPQDPYDFMRQQMGAWVVQSAQAPTASAPQPAPRTAEKTQSPWGAPAQPVAVATAPGVLTTPAKTVEATPPAVAPQGAWPAVAPVVAPPAAKAAMPPVASPAVFEPQPPKPVAPGKVAPPTQPKEPERAAPKPAAPAAAPAVELAQPKQPERAVVPTPPATTAAVDTAPRPPQQPKAVQEQPRAVQDEDAGLRSLKQQLRDHLKEAVENGNLEKFMRSVTAGEEPQQNGMFPPASSLSPQEQDLKVRMRALLEGAMESGELEKKLGAVRESEAASPTAQTPAAPPAQTPAAPPAPAPAAPACDQRFVDHRISKLKNRMRDMLETAADSGNLAAAFESIQASQASSQQDAGQRQAPPPGQEADNSALRPQVGPTLLESNKKLAEDRALKARVRETLEAAAATGALKEALDTQFPQKPASTTEQSTAPRLGPAAETEASDAAPAPPTSPPRPEPSPPAASPPNLPIPAPTGSVSMIESQTATDGGTEADGAKELEAHVRKLEEDQKEVVEDSDKLKAEMQRLEAQMEQLREQHSLLHRKSMQRPGSAIASRSPLQNAGAATMSTQAARPTSAGPRS